MSDLLWRPIAVVNDIDPSPYRNFDAAARGTATSPVHPQLRPPGEWVNCTDYRYRSYSPCSSLATSSGVRPQSAREPPSQSGASISPLPYPKIRSPATPEPSHGDVYRLPN